MGIVSFACDRFIIIVIVIIHLIMSIIQLTMDTIKYKIIIWIIIHLTMSISQLIMSIIKYMVIIWIIGITTVCFIVITSIMITIGKS